MNKTVISVGGRLIALVIALGGLGACGQKGPLTLPKPAGAASTPAGGR